MDPATPGVVPFHETLRTVVQHFLDERQRARSAAASLQRSDLLWNKAPDAVQLAKLLEGKGFVRVTKSGHDEILSAHPVVGITCCAALAVKGRV